MSAATSLGVQAAAAPGPSAAASALVAKLARPDILRLQPYQHASWDPTLERLHANENPWRFPGDVSRSGLNRYPEPHPLEVEARLATLYGVRPAQVLAGRGSDEGIDLLVRGFCEAARDAIVTCPPTFGMYKVAARIQGADVVEVPLLRERGYALDPDAVLRACDDPRVKLVFLCSPNNPTGNSVDPRAIERVVRELADRAFVIVDEAYAEFAAQPSFVPRLAEFPNLGILRTLSKAYALAGARCGALLANAPVIELLRRMIPPYALPAPTMEAVLTALEPARLAQARERIGQLLAERDRLAEGFANLRIVARVWPSDANFLLIETTDAPAFLAAGLRAGLLLRDFSANPQTPGCVRVSVGTPDQNDRLLRSVAAA
ncbi:MAG: histidinol-phosphate transaminase [Steroidobacteraceae bacterium]|nr:histidinol-phosphate transaminase [Steroidobacteraceae bacterium]